MYNIDSLEKGIDQCKVSIKSLEDAADRERATIKEYRDMIDTLNERKRIDEEVPKMGGRIEVVRE